MRGLFNLILFINPGFLPLKTPVIAILFFSCFLLVPSNSFSQQKIVTGIVTEPNGSPLPGATVGIKNSTRQTITDAKGLFSIPAVEKDILVITFVGHASREIAVGAATIFSIALTESAINLDEVVMTGYTSQKVKEITGSVAVVKTKDLTAIPAGQVEQMLQGRVAGLSVITSGEPGAPATIRLHGIGNFGDVTPLYIIDGVQGDINSLNPDDIESLQVLKDAAGYSIYGVRGANGVIVVTTRKGKQGKPRITYDMYLGWQKPLKGLELLNPKENADLLWLSLKNSGFLSSNGNPNDHLFGNGPEPVLPDYLFAGYNQDTLFEGSPYVADSLYNLVPGNDAIYQIVKFNKAGTDWFHEMYKPAFSQKHTINISGGNDKNQYLVSLGYLDQQGTLLNTQLKRYTARVNTEFNYNNRFRFGENLQLNYSQDMASDLLHDGSGNDLYAAISTSPAQPVYDTHGAWNPQSNYPRVGPYNNPVARRVMANDNKSNRWQVLGNIYAALDFLKYFSLRTSFGGSLTNYYSYKFRPASYDNVTDPNKFTEASGYISSYTWTNSLNFSRSIGVHSIKVLAATEIVNNSNRGLEGSARNLAFTAPNYWLLNNGYPDVPPNYSFAGISKLSSFIGRMDYGFKEKYFLSATIRRDGSSVFGPENRFGWFPSVAVAWRLTEENFLQKAQWLTDLKLRASWGKTGFYGNTDPFNQYTLYNGTIGGSFYDISGNSTGNIQRGFSLVRIGNPKTGWQEDIMTNIGLDANFWNGKLSFTADWYIKESRGLLFQLALPDLLGDAISPNVNIGNIRNTGIDLAIGSKGHFSKDWKWDVLLTFSHYNNKIIELNDLPYFDDLYGIVRNEVGHPISSFFGYKVIGLFQDEADVTKSPVQLDAAPGRFKYADTNGRDAAGKLTGKPDGHIDDADRIHYGNPHPDFTLGINIGISFKNFDFSTFLYGSFGNDVLNFVRAGNDIKSFPDGLGPASKTALYDSWTPERRNAHAPKAEVIANFSNGAYQSIPLSYPMEKGSYLRNKSLMLGYTFSRNTLDKIKVEKLRIYIQAVNLFTLTKYQGLDPELANSGALSWQSTKSVFGIDQGNYPNNQQQFLFGLTIGL